MAKYLIEVPESDLNYIVEASSRREALIKMIDDLMKRDPDTEKEIIDSLALFVTDWKDIIKL